MIKKAFRRGIKICVVFIEKIRYKIECNKMKKYIASTRKQTSTSDDTIYPTVCQLAATEDAVFDRFRRNVIYNRVLEHISRYEGKEYLEIIDRSGELHFEDKDWDNFMQNDLYGFPRVFSYKLNGRKRKISPTTLRYIKVLKDIKTLFNTNEFIEVAEIGVGYAGQCRILTSSIDSIKHYTLFDLPEVLKLTQKYLGKFGKVDKYIFADGTNITADREYDFVVSNYAFSELTREVQDIYMEKVILKAKAGYITWNTASYNAFGGYSLEALLELLPGSKSIPEEPLTAHNNCIIIWGFK